jgi:hypothetical protein
MAERGHFSIATTHTLYGKQKCLADFPISLPHLWLGWMDLNHRMPGPKPGALPLGYNPIIYSPIVYHVGFEPLLELPKLPCYRFTPHSSYFRILIVCSTAHKLLDEPQGSRCYAQAVIRCAFLISYKQFHTLYYCGPDRNRTYDLFLARELLSQLSYEPEYRCSGSAKSKTTVLFELCL